MLPGAGRRERDLAFGNSLNTLLPTLMGGRIDSRAKAIKARDELLDIARGSNAAGANAKKLNMRSLPVGIIYPQWSADAFNATDSDLSQATINDWVGDVALEPSSADRAQWLALQDAYLAQPSNRTFWEMFKFVKWLDVAPSLQGVGQVKHFAEIKYRSALIGQHLLRMERVGTGASLGFVGDSPLSFSYLLYQDNFGMSLQDLPNWSLLPSKQLWDVADEIGRVMIGNQGYYVSATTALAKIGLPKFVVDSQTSVRENSKTVLGGELAQELRLAWFWIGFTMDPSLYHLGVSGATLGGEYILATLGEEDTNMYLHRQFLNAMRLVARTLPEIGFGQDNQYNGTPFTPVPKEFYFGTYGPDGAYDIAKADRLLPGQISIYGPMTANTMRMQILLYLDALDRPGSKKISKEEFDSYAVGINNVFKAYSENALLADQALMAQLRSRLGYN